MIRNHNPELQNSRILEIYSIYRLTLPLMLLLSYFISPVNTRLGSIDPQTFLFLTAAYSIYALLLALLTIPGLLSQPRNHTLGTLFLTDILVIALISYSSGGMVSGLGLLLLVSVAAGSLLIRGRPALLLPAIASIAILYTEVYLHLSGLQPGSQYIQAGLLGTLLFLTSIYLQHISERMRESAELAEEQASSIQDLEQLNYHIIQRMRTGVALLDDDYRVLSSNNAARELLRMRKSAVDDQYTLPAALPELIDTWRKKANSQPVPQKLTPAGPDLQLNFAYLNPNQSSDILVFVEDNSTFVQRARQMKLASLGRLTAGIAHEIRNPLGAIGHAAQLLDESGKLEDDDRHLLAMVLSNSKRINLIIEDVLQLSRQPEQRAEVITLKPWLEAFITQYQDAHQPDGEISLHISPNDCQIRFVESQLEQVLDNLLQNGLRYSYRSCGRETLELKAGYSESTGHPWLYVIDEGVGIPADEEDRLFEPFHTTEPGGTGLGLYISRQLCEANHARLLYKRMRSGKSRFIIHFAHPGRDIS